MFLRLTENSCTSSVHNQPCWLRRVQLVGVASGVRLGQLQRNNHGSFGVRRLVAAMARASERKRRQVAALHIGTRYLSVFCAYPAAETDCHFQLPPLQSSIVNRQYSMAPHAGELYTITHSARGLIRYRPVVRMQVDEAGGVTGRLQSCIFGMAVRAAERRIDLAVADKAIRHPGKMLGCRKIGFSHPAVAGEAGIIGIQMTAHVSGKSEVTAAVDRASKGRGDISETKVQFVIEAKA